MLERGVWGFLVSPNDATATGAAVVLLVQHAALRARCGNMAHECVSNLFHVSGYLNQLDALYRSEAQEKDPCTDLSRCKFRDGKVFSKTTSSGAPRRLKPDGRSAVATGESSQNGGRLEWRTADVRTLPPRSAMIVFTGGR